MKIDTTNTTTEKKKIVAPVSHETKAINAAEGAALVLSIAEINDAESSGAAEAESAITADAAGFVLGAISARAKRRVTGAARRAALAAVDSRLAALVSKR